MNGDEIAGVVDLFGALERAELERALEELAFKRGENVDTGEIDGALATRALIEVERESETLLVAGPEAFPTVPDGAADLPHILDVERRTVDREAVAASVEEQVRAEAAQAAADGDEDRIEDLLDATYELESWAAVDLAALRERLDRALQD